MRALWLAYPNDARALAVDDAYLWGESLLVAPVTASSAKDRTIYLPHGQWFDYWTGEEIFGGLDHIRPVDLATMPLYVKAGTILPLGPIKQSTLEPSTTPIELHIYPGSDARFALYEDDGISMDHTRGISSTIDMRWNDQLKRLSLALAPGSVMRSLHYTQFPCTACGQLGIQDPGLPRLTNSHRLLMQIAPPAYSRRRTTPSRPAPRRIGRASAPLPPAPSPRSPISTPRARPSSDTRCRWCRTADRRPCGSSADSPPRRTPWQSSCHSAATPR